MLDSLLTYHWPYLVLRLPGGSRLRFADHGDGTYTAYPGAQTTLSAVEDAGVVTYTLTAADETTRIFDAVGRLRLIRDRHGNETTLYYDTYHRLAQVVGPNGLRSLDFGYDAAGRLSWMRDPSERTFTYGYDGAGDLVVVTDTRGLAWSYTYTGSHLLHEVFNPAGQLVERTDYDGQGRAISQVDAAGKRLVITYDAFETTITDGGRAVVHRYDEFGTLIEDVNAAGYSDGATYNADFRPTEQTDALGRTTELARCQDGCCSCGQVSAITDALNHTTYMSYDDGANLTTITDTLGHVTAYVYDENNNLLSQTDAAGKTVRYAYDAYGHVISTTNAAGETTTYGYDAWGQRTVVTDATGMVTRYGYDAVGRLITTTAATGLVTVNAYDDGDNMIQVTRNYTTAGRQNYLGLYNQVTAYGYDAVGRRVLVTDTLDTVTRSAYDDAGRLVRTWRNYLWGQPQNYQGTYNLVTAYGYDDLGRQVLVTDTLGSVTYTEYDALDRVSRTWRNYWPGQPQNYQDAYNLVTTYGYDAVGNQTHVTDTLGSVTYTEYDALNRAVRT